MEFTYSIYNSHSCLFLWTRRHVVLTFLIVYTVIWMYIFDRFSASHGLIITARTDEII